MLSWAGVKTGLRQRLRRVAIKPLPWRRWWSSPGQSDSGWRVRLGALAMALAAHLSLLAARPDLTPRLNPVSVPVQLMAQLPQPPSPPALAAAPKPPPPKPETSPRPAPAPAPVEKGKAPPPAPRPVAAAPAPPAPRPKPQPAASQATPPPAQPPPVGGDSPHAPPGAPAPEAPPVANPNAPADAPPVEGGGAPGQPGAATSRRIPATPGRRQRPPGSRDRRTQGDPKQPDRRREAPAKSAPAHLPAATTPRRPARPVYTNQSRGDYLAGLHSALEARKTYPLLAERELMEGEVTLELKIAPGGRLWARVIKSSGYPLLDDAALQAVASLGRYQPFAPDMAPKTITQPLVLRFVLR